MKPLSDWELELDADENAGRTCHPCERGFLLGLVGMVVCLVTAACTGCVR